MLRMNQESNEVKIRNKMCRCKFRFDESMLTGIKRGLWMVWNVLMYDNFKHLGKDVESTDRSVIIHQEILSFFEYVNNGSLLQESRENSLW
jgi:hypothetical protein